MRPISFLLPKPFRSYKPTKVGLSTQTQIDFFDKFRDHCSIIFWRILENFTCFDIYWKRSFRWDQSHFCGFCRFGVISRQRWVCQPKHKSTFLINSEFTVALFFDEFSKFLHVLLSTEKDLSDEPHPIFVALIVLELTITHKKKLHNLAWLIIKTILV